MRDCRQSAKALSSRSFVEALMLRNVTLVVVGLLAATLIFATAGNPPKCRPGETQQMLAHMVPIGPCAP
jgi:uncharacterized lipoprotein YajG